MRIVCAAPGGACPSTTMAGTTKRRPVRNGSAFPRLPRRFAPRNDTSGEREVHQRPPTVELLPTGRSLSAATDPVGGGCHFNDSLCESFVQHREVHAPPLQWRVPRNGGRYGTAVPSRDCSPRALPHSFFSLHSFPCPAPTAHSPARHKKAPIFRSELHVGVTYLSVQSPAKYCRRK